MQFKKDYIIIAINYWLRTKMTPAQKSTWTAIFSFVDGQYVVHVS